jgi:alkanesulfonate monooxygenase SsuD/methylene tetrahydromethanopterin reductase-like flavin-dependent oxidoreductase (luciferase family)
VTHHGRYFQLYDAKASVRPKQSPRPPIWVGGDVEPAVRRAARIADAWCVERRKTGQLEDVSCPVIRECFVGRDAAHAAKTSRGPLLFKYRAYASWGQGETTGNDFDAAFDGFARDRFLIGDAEHVKDEILRYAETARTDHILLRVQWPGLAHEEALGNIERIGRIIATLS